MVAVFCFVCKSPGHCACPVQRLIRRELRHHRAALRCAIDLLTDLGYEETELREEVLDITGRSLSDLSRHHVLDAPSDDEAMMRLDSVPERLQTENNALREESCGRVLDMLHGMTHYKRMCSELDRARMKLEDRNVM